MIASGTLGDTGEVSAGVSLLVMGGDSAGTMGEAREPSEPEVSAGVLVVVTGGDLVGIVGETSEVSAGVSSMTTEDDLMVLAAHAAACAHIRLRNPPFFDVEVGAESLSLAIRSPVQPASFLKRSLV